MTIASDKKELMYHLGHKIVIAFYGDEENPESVTVECETCNVVLYEEQDNFIVPLICED